MAIGDGMEFTIHGDLKNKGKKNKQLMNNSKVSVWPGVEGNFEFSLHIRHSMHQNEHYLDIIMALKFIFMINVLYL